MRITVELLGTRLELTLSPVAGDERAGDRDGQADALVERIDPEAPTLGFGYRPREDA